MNRLRFALLSCSTILFCGLLRAAPEVALSSHVVDDNSRSVLIDIKDASGQAFDEVRIELPRNAAETAVLSGSPKDWKLERDGHSVKLSGPATKPPVKLRLMLFDLGMLDRIRARVRSQGKDLLDARVMATELPRLQLLTNSGGLLELPPLMSPGETLEMKILDLKKTPPDGQWAIAGIVATPVAPDRVRVQVPADFPAGSPVRVSFFDAFGERIVDALSTPGSSVADRASVASATPKITGCARYAFLGQTMCVCGEFPESARGGLRLDGQPAVVVSASRSSVRILLPESLAPGMHEITGDPQSGFSPSDKTTVLALRLKGSLDANALLRGQSTTMRLGVEGTTDPMKMAVTVKTPGVISIPGGNYLELTTPGGENNVAERRVDATGRGNFQIDYRLDGARCPCEELPQERASTASQNGPILVPRRVLATIAIGTPAAMYATAQAIAAANGLAVVEVFPIVLTNEGLAVFEIVDGIGALAKAAAVAADPRATLVQVDIVYDTSQQNPSQQNPSQPGAAANSLFYGPRLIGVDLVQGISRGDGVRVGVIDTGIDTGHPDLRQKVAEFSDVTGTGWTPDAHGSLVAGVIAADAGSGSAGVAPGAKLVAVKSCVAQSTESAAARCWSSTLARGIDAAAQKNVRVLNLSVGGPEDKLLAKMVDAAIKKGIAVVSAAGNDGPSGKPSYPAAFKGVIAVTAVDAAEHIYPRATRGSYVSLAAPGVDILSTGPGNRTQAFSGTSAATAFTSGAVALLIQQRPNVTLPELQSILQQTAKRLGPAAPDPEFGYGLLDVCRAMARLSNKQAACR